MTSSPQPCPTCAAPHEICCVAEIMQHQTHSRSPLTHEDMLGRHRSEAGFISSFFPASSPSAETPGLTSRSARSYRELAPIHAWLGLLFDLYLVYDSVCLPRRGWYRGKGSGRKAASARGCFAQGPGFYTPP